MYVCMLVVRDLLVFWYGILICCWTYVFGCKWVHSLTHSLTHHTLHITVECRQAYATPPNKWEGGIG